MKLTLASVQKLKLPAGKPDHIEWDTDVPGFGVRLRGKSRTYVFQYKSKSGDQYRETLGKLSAMDFTRAQKEAKERYAKVTLGEDPVKEARNARQAAVESPDTTFKATVDAFVAWQKTRPRKTGRVGLKPRSILEIERHLCVHAKTLHDLQLDAVTRKKLSDCIRRVRDSSGFVAANRVRSTLSSLFAWAMKDGQLPGLESNPVAFTFINEESTRERTLSDDEIRIIWKHLEADQYGDIVQLLLLTAQRRDEIGGCRRSELDEEGNLRLPGERTKNGLPHIVPLSSPALEIINRQPTRTLPSGEIRDLIFGFRAGPFAGWSNCKERLDARIAEGTGRALPPWRLHDLRRTAVTGMQKLGVLPHVIEQVLNHSSGHKAGVAGVYQRYTYEPEKRAALERWADHVGALVQGGKSNVTSLRRA